MEIDQGPYEVPGDNYPLKDDAFYTQLEKTRNELNTLQCHVNTLNEIYDQTLVNVIFTRGFDYEEKIEKQSSLTSATLQRVQDSIQRLNHAIASEPHERVKINLLASLTNDFLEVQKQLKTSQEEFKEESIRFGAFRADKVDGFKANDAQNSKNIFDMSKVLSMKKRKEKNGKKLVKMDRSLGDVGWLFTDALSQYIMEGQIKTIYRIKSIYRIGSMKEEPCA